MSLYKIWSNIKTKDKKQRAKYKIILKQKIKDKEQLSRYHWGIWLGSQKNYSTIKKNYILFYVFQNSKIILSIF
jgi:hypothetical protein